MKKVIERIVESPGAPNENDLWLNGTTLKKFQNGEWVAISGGGGGGSASGLSDMTDVDISSPSDGDTLVYNATTGKWENGSGGGCSCLPPMIVAGTFASNNNEFIPNEGAPTFEEAQNQMFRGGLVYFLATYDGEPFGAMLAIESNPDFIEAIYDGVSYYWSKPVITIEGTLNSDFHTFIPNAGQMSWSDAKQAFDDGEYIKLYDDNRNLAVSVVDYDPNAEGGPALVTNERDGVPFYWYEPPVV